MWESIKNAITMNTTNTMHKTQEFFFSIFIATKFMLWPVKLFVAHGELAIERRDARRTKTQPLHWWHANIVIWSNTEGLWQSDTTLRLGTQCWDNRSASHHDLCRQFARTLDFHRKWHPKPAGLGPMKPSGQWHNTYSSIRHLLFLDI